MKEQQILNALISILSQSFALNGGDVIATTSDIKKAYQGVRANNETTLTFDSTADKGDRSITVELAKGEVFMFPMKNLSVDGGSVLAFL